MKHKQTFFFLEKKHSCAAVCLCEQGSAQYTSLCAMCRAAMQLIAHPVIWPKNLLPVPKVWFGFSRHMLLALCVLYVLLPALAKGQICSQLPKVEVSNLF
jgi:hypothetical protein